MQTIEQAANTLGLTPRQLRRRIEASSPVLAPHLQRGDKNRLLLDHGAVEILRAVEDRRVSGATLKDATAWVAVSIRGEEKSEQRQGEERTERSTVSDLPLVAELRDRIRFLEDENGRLWSLVGDLKALPAPRSSRRSLFSIFRRRHGATT